MMRGFIFSGDVSDVFVCWLCDFRRGYELVWTFGSEEKEYFYFGYLVL
jgi:hypothetical protein